MEGNLIKINKWLYPVSWLYGTGVWLRNKLFDWGIYKERKFDVPIISVGNITVGGTGKTPHTEYLIRLNEYFYWKLVDYFSEHLKGRSEKSVDIPKR